MDTIVERCLGVRCSFGYSGSMFYIVKLDIKPKKVKTFSTTTSC